MQAKVVKTITGDNDFEYEIVEADVVGILRTTVGVYYIVGFWKPDDFHSANAIHASNKTWPSWDEGRIFKPPRKISFTGPYVFEEGLEQQPLKIRFARQIPARVVPVD